MNDFEMVPVAIIIIIIIIITCFFPLKDEPKRLRRKTCRWYNFSTEPRNERFVFLACACL